MDAFREAGKQTVVALGVTVEGKKIPLGFVEASTEHHEPVKGLLRDLIDRGLTFDQGILFVTDGARGLHKAIRETIGDYGLIQRCQWHKREHVATTVGEHRWLPSEKRPQKVASEVEAILP